MTASQITPYQAELLQHTLGLNEHCRQSSRNHFVAGEGHHDMRHLETLEGMGLMERRRSPGFLTAGDIVFAATDTGRAAALAALPEPKPRTKYEDYLDADGCAGDSFGEFLCGDRLPKYERRTPFLGNWRDTEYRMYRTHSFPYDFQREVEGDWCKTMKDAKASYKAALKRHHEKQRAILKCKKQAAHAAS